jgi:Flp pilus assembly protein TadG
VRHDDDAEVELRSAMGLLKKIHSNDSAQMLPIFVMLMLVLVGMVGLATDLGRVYVARAQLGRSVDAAALAGAKQLPDIAAADSKARAFITENEPNSTINVQVYPDVPSQQVGVTATKTVNTIFMRLVGINTVSVSNNATAGFGIVPVDAVMALDATGSMGASPCNGSQNNSGCPIWEAKNAATAFTNTLLPGNNTVVGVHAFRGCFKGSPAGGTNTNCVAMSSVGALNGTASNVNSKISAITAVGGTGTNVCGGLNEAQTVLFGTNSHNASNTIRVIVILTDGDTTYNNVSYVSGSPGSPALACRPNSSGSPACPTGTSSQCNPANSDTYLSTGCSAAGSGSVSGSNPGSNSEPHERQLDIKADTLATTLKNSATQPVEIYVVGFGVCGTEDNVVPKTSAGAFTANYCQNIGNSNPDTVGDQRLLKCMASSSAGTNDHYFRASTSTELPGIFSAIAQAIAFRLIK